MKSLEQIYILNYLSEQVWNTATGLLDIVERFDLYDKAEGETEKDFYWTDAVGQLEGWRTQIGGNSKTWEDSLNEIDLEEVNIELLDDCPDNSTLQNRLRIVKNRYFGTWEITKAGEGDVVFDKLLHIVDRLTEILFTVYDWSKDDAHRKAVKWHDYLLQKWCNIGQLQNYMQSVIDNAENILNHQHDTTTELPSIFHQFAVLRDNFRMRNAFVYAMEAGLMEIDGVYFKWLKKRQLLAYFCRSVGNDLIPDADNVQWSVFNGMFIAKRGREYEVENNETLRCCYIDYETKTRTSKRDTPPDGWEIVDSIIERATL